MLRDMDRRFRGIEQRFEPFLALYVGKAGQIFTVQRKQIEGIESETVRCGLRSLAALQHFLQAGKIGIALGIMGDDFAVDKAGRQIECGDSVNQGAELVGPVLPVARVNANSLALCSNQRAIAVELDFVHPAISGRDIVDERCKLWLAVFWYRRRLALLRLGLSRIMRRRLFHLRQEGIVLLARQRIFAVLVRRNFRHCTPGQNAGQFALDERVTIFGVIVLQFAQ